MVSPSFDNLGHCFCPQTGHSIHLHTFSIPFYNPLMMVVLSVTICLLVCDSLPNIADKQISHYFDNVHHSMWISHRILYLIHQIVRKLWRNLHHFHIVVRLWPNFHMHRVIDPPRQKNSLHQRSTDCRKKTSFNYFKPLLIGWSLTFTMFSQPNPVVAVGWWTAT